MTCVITFSFIAHIITAFNNFNIYIIEANNIYMYIKPNYFKAEVQFNFFKLNFKHEVFKIFLFALEQFFKL